MDRENASTPVDLSLLEVSTDGDRELQREIVGEFIPASEVRLATIRKLLGEDNPVAIRNEALALGAGGGVVGALLLTAIARDLEGHAERCDIVGCTAALDRLESEFERVRAYLRERVAVA